MNNKSKRIGIVTRDCAGVNAAIRSVVRTACDKGIEVFGFLKGYEGVMSQQGCFLSRRDVSGILNLGGTILKTARAARFLTQQGQQEALAAISALELDGIIVIGGNGSLSGAHVLADKYSIPTVGIPATIDNDVNGIDLTIGADTAVNVALDALDKIRDTVSSLERIFVVEVMGRESGYIALQVALAGGCEEVVFPEKEFDISLMCGEIQEGNKKGKKSWIIIVAEGKAKAEDIADKISKKTGLETRIAVLGHIQRGGRPTAVDRILAARLGNYAVELLSQGISNVCVGVRNGRLFSIPLAEAIRPKAMETEPFYRLIKVLT